MKHFLNRPKSWDSGTKENTFGQTNGVWNFNCIMFSYFITVEVFINTFLEAYLIHRFNRVEAVEVASKQNHSASAHTHTHTVG